MQGGAWAAVALLIWAGWFGVTRAGVRGTLGIADVAALRLGIGALLLLPGFLRGAARIPRRGWAEGVVLSAAWGAPFVLLLGRGVQLTSAAYAAGLVPSTMPVFAGLLAWIFRRERPTPRRLAGYGVIVAAVLVLALVVPGPRNAWADLLLMGASLSWAVYTLRVGRSGLSPAQAAALTCIYSAAVFLPVYWVWGLSGLASVPVRELVVQGVYQGVLAGAGAILAFTRAVALLGPASASAVTSLVPVVATMLAVPLAGEWPGPLELSADVAIGAGVWLATQASAGSLSGRRAP